MGIAIVEVPEWLATPSGAWHLDLLPVVTMAACLPVIAKQFKDRRYLDGLLCGTGFALAVIFHLLHMDPRGLHNVKWANHAGTTWRTWDIVVAQVVLMRALSTAIGDRHPAVWGMANVVLPGAHFVQMFTRPSLHIGQISATTGACALLMLTAKILLDRNQVPAYSGRAEVEIAAWSCLAFFCFYMPHEQPSLYWAWHSVWHVMMAIAFWKLYSELSPAKQALNMSKAAAKRKAL